MNSQQILLIVMLGAFLVGIYFFLTIPTFPILRILLYEFSLVILALLVIFVGGEVQ